MYAMNMRKEKNSQSQLLYKKTKEPVLLGKQPQVLSAWGNQNRVFSRGKSEHVEKSIPELVNGSDP